MRKSVARAALLLLALAALVTFVAPHAPGGVRVREAAAFGARAADDVHTLVAVPVRAAEWLTGEPRHASGTDGLAAALLLSSVLVAATGWRRVAFAPHRHPAAVATRRASSRAPPAFA
jgi:hypothetical protein